MGTKPNSITVVLNTGSESGEITVDGKPSKAGNMYYNGAAVGLVLDGPITEALANTSASYNGETLKAGEVHRTEPSVFGKNHRRAGEAVPGTGGQWTITHSATIVLGGERYTLLVTLIEKPEGIKVRVSAMKQPGSRAPQARISGLTFATA